MSPAVLVVEDEHGIAELIRDRLGDEGFQARVAYTGAEALRELKGKIPDIITMDIYLPDSNGLRILENLKSDPDTRKIPVIIISSSDEGEGAKDLGAEGFIRKPINFKKLFEIIDSVKARNNLVETR